MWIGPGADMDWCRRRCAAAAALPHQRVDAVSLCDPRFVGHAHRQIAQPARRLLLQQYWYQLREEGGALLAAAACHCRQQDHSAASPIRRTSRLSASRAAVRYEWRANMAVGHCSSKLLSITGFG